NQRKSIITILAVIPFSNLPCYPNIIHRKSIFDFLWGFGGEVTKLSYRWLSKLESFDRLAI
ncbi:TPA: hypothetical protein ACOZKM_002016, partial [Streptococcus pneumoniae]